LALILSPLERGKVKRGAIPQGHIGTLSALIPTPSLKREGYFYLFG